MNLSYNKLSKAELQNLQIVLKNEYNELKARGLKLDMSRGKPSAKQLDLAMEMLDTVNSNTDAKSKAGTDCRNYGSLEGLDELREMFGYILDVQAHQILVGGNSSLNLMFDVLSRAMLVGFQNSPRPWCKEDKVRFICPSPGYDRHFAICEYFGIEMITVDMTDEGPDMDTVERLVAADSTIKGIWCVPKYSNPTGVVYSERVLQRLAALQPMAKDFIIMYDNAYAVHDLYADCPPLPNIYTMLEKNGCEDRIYMFTSTSKISFAGGGSSALGASPANIERMKKQLGIQIISYDKMNQLMHVRFFKNTQGVKAHMDKHREILQPKFIAVEEILASELGGLGIATWTKPQGGYFISLNTMDNCAKRVVELCKEAGVTLTPAGATYPYGNDVSDSNIRIAPSYPEVEELIQATNLLTLCIKLTSVEKHLQN